MKNLKYWIRIFQKSHSTVTNHNLFGSNFYETNVSCDQFWVVIHIIPQHKESSITTTTIISDVIFSKRYGSTPRGVRGVIRSEILWEIQKFSLPGLPSSQNWIKSKSIYHFLMNFDAFSLFFILLNFGWMVDLAMSIFVFLTKFLIFWHPRHPRVCICSNLKPLFETEMSDSSYCVS